MSLRYSVLLFSGLCIQATNLQTLTQNVSPYLSAPTDDVSCGRNVLTTDHDRIDYRMNSTVEPNERCVWIIRPNTRQLRGTGFQLNVTFLDFPGTTSDHGLTVIGFARNEVEQEKINSPGVYIMPDSSVLAVMFFTGSKAMQYSGFSLSYVAFLNGTGGASPDSHDYFMSSKEDSQLHPPDSGLYAPLEQTLFVITSPDNLFNPGKLTEIEVQMGVLWDNCQDLMTIYSFSPGNVLGGSAWRNMTELCVGSYSESYVTRDLMLLHFESNEDEGIRGKMIVRYINRTLTI